MITTGTFEAAAALIDGTLPELATLDDAALLASQTSIAALSRIASRHAAAAAGELAHRSRRDLGYAGLAQSTGHRTPEALLQSLTGTTSVEAARLVRVGTLPPDSPVAEAVTSGALSVDAADSIRRGLGAADQHTSAESLNAAARDLLATAGMATPEQLYRAAADARTALDLARVAAREQARRELRYARVRMREDGMVSGSFLLDQEDGQLLISALDTIMSPRRGGPRFIAAAEREAAEALLADPRSNDQLAADALIDMVRLAVDADRGSLFGRRRPAVRVIVTARELVSGVGTATIEGAPEPISIDTARRHACGSGLVGVLFSDSGQPLDVGRTQRLYTERQRIALSVRDGGCRFPGCTRRPEMCEAHHVRHWHRDRGPTDTDDGILLCRHHHMLVHNNGWEITRVSAAEQATEHPAHLGSPGLEYLLVPPRSVDPRQRPVPLPSKSRQLRELVRA